METKDILLKMVLDTQEMVRDFEVHSKEINDNEVREAFKHFAEQAGFQSQRLKELLGKYEYQ